MAKLFEIAENTDKDVRIYVDALDRSSLGEFAVEYDFLVTAIKYALYTQAREVVTGAEETVLGIEDVLLRIRVIESQIGDTLNECPDGEYVERSVAEAMFWGFDNPDENSDNTMWLARYRIIAHSPSEFRDYFRIGIWNVPRIEDFVANGIDPELAIRLVSSGE